MDKTLSPHPSTDSILPDGRMLNPDWITVNCNLVQDHMALLT